MDSTTYQIAVIVGAILVGVLCGLAPLITGLVKKQTSMAIIGFFSSIVGGFILGILLALPIAIVFTVLIVLKKKDTGSVPPDPPNFQ